MIVHTAQPLTPAQEHVFWLEVLEDHAFFVRNHLAPIETAYIQQAQAFIERFQRHLRELCDIQDNPQDVASETWQSFARNVYPTAADYFQFEGHLQNRRIVNDVLLNLTPTYFNGTLNENQEYLRLLSFYINGHEPVQLPLWDLLQLWLEDQLGHAVLLRNALDPVEFGLSEQASRFSQAFQAYIVKNNAIRGYLRFTEPNFPAQRHFAATVAGTTVEFYRFVQTIVAQYRHTTLLSRTTLRFLEHHFPETCYLLIKLSAFAEGVELPQDCSLTKPGFTQDQVPPREWI